MKYNIKDMIDKCEPCQQLRPSKPVEPFIHTRAKFPMEQISVDLFHVHGKNYVVIADRYSGYIWVERLINQDTKAVTDVLDRITRIFGIPLVCRTDGGPQFRGPFKKYCLEKGISHEQSSPYNPQSNGHAESAVKTAKYLLLKTKPSTFPSALAAWRNTERENKPSPNELMFCRKIRDNKVIIKSQLHLSNLQIHESKTQELKSGIDHDTPTDLATIKQNVLNQQFLQGDKVHVQSPCTKRWDETALITGLSRTGRTLELLTAKGDIIVRNRRYVRKQCAV